MRVGPVSPFAQVVPYTSPEIEVVLSKIAEQHNTTVPELIKSAAAAGPDGPSYLIRVTNLVRRLERLKASE